MERAGPSSVPLQGTWHEHMLLQYDKKEGFIKAIVDLAAGKSDKAHCKNGVKLLI